MDLRDHLPIPLKKGLGKQSKELTQIEPLRRIPEPPTVYREWKASVDGLEDKPEQIDQIRKKMNKAVSGFSKEVGNYLDRLLSIREHNLTWAARAIQTNQVEFIGEGISPLEKIEIREQDHRKHGRSVWMLLVDFEFYKRDGEEISKRVYIPVQIFDSSRSWIKEPGKDFHHRPDCRYALAEWKQEDRFFCSCGRKRIGKKEDVQERITIQERIIRWNQRKEQLDATKEIILKEEKQLEIQEKLIESLKYAE